MNFAIFPWTHFDVGLSNREIFIWESLFTTMFYKCKILVLSASLFCDNALFVASFTQRFRFVPAQQYS